MDMARRYSIKPWTVKGMMTAWLSLLQSVLSDQAKAKTEVQHALALIKHAQASAKTFARSQVHPVTGWIPFERLVAVRDTMIEPTAAKVLLGHLTLTAAHLPDLHACKVLQA